MANPASRIQLLGFRRWYERTLIESHAYLVTCFLGMILIATSFEFGQHGVVSWQGLTRIVLGFCGAGLCAFTLLRYRQLMIVAEMLAEKATCPSCDRYAAFEVTAHGPRSPEEAAHHAVRPDEYPWMRVRCRKCEHIWTV
jgi:hypothetical protein